MEELEERKRLEIEHSRVRRTILQNSERQSDTNEQEQADRLEHLIRDKELFDRHFANIKYYAVARASETYQHQLMRKHCRPGSRVLDFACGNGENGLFAAQLGSDVTGIDISPEGIANANLNAKKSGAADFCRFKVMGVENTIFSNKTS